MSRLQEKEPQQSPKKDTPNLKGTFISVMLVGVFILVSWFGVFLLFITR
ncbi:cytochrome c oxidase subunit 2A [Virgibacillus sp. NKC19-3]|nr:cytochrome c oxidase subunit 2A [Virgibacillus sp. NKC19-3]MBY7143527.1 cytochrome c oxidase subunit 2A [Virgibacillus sp. NKC19-3]